jgi:UDP-sugar transporter A1/2/3
MAVALLTSAPDGALLQTFSQGKLISTALFATLMLHKKLSRWQWTSVAALGLGVILVQQGSPHGPASAPPPPGSPPPGFALSGAATGLIAITTACVISGFAGVYTEMILKGQAEFWAVNAQLSAFSLVPALIPLLTNAMDAQGHWAPMRYFGAWAWASVLLNVSGGLLVSLVVKVADNVAKGFAVALAIVLTFLFSAVFLSYSITLACAAGVAVVVLSMVVYSTNPPPKPAQSETVFDARETDAHDTEYESADQSMDERSDSPPHTAIRLPTHVISEEEDKLG